MYSIIGSNTFHCGVVTYVNHSLDRCNRKHLPEPEKRYGTTKEDMDALENWMNHMARCALYL